MKPFLHGIAVLLLHDVLSLEVLAVEINPNLDTDSMSVCSAGLENSSACEATKSPKRPLTLQEYDPVAATAMWEMHAVTCLCAAVIVSEFILCYFVTTHPDPVDRERPSFWKFVFGLLILPHYRSPWDRPFGNDDWPQGPFKASVHPERLVPWMEACMKDGMSVEGMMWKYTLPRYAVCHLFCIIQRFINIYAMANMNSIILVWLYLPEEYCPYFPLQFAFGMCVVWMSLRVNSALMDQIVGCGGSIPFLQSIYILLQRKLQLLSNEAGIGGAEIQQLTGMIGELGVGIFTCPLRGILVDMVALVWCLRQLYQSFGLICIVIGVVIVYFSGKISSMAVGIGVEKEKESFRLRNERNKHMEFVVSNMKVLRQSNWLHRAAKPLDDAVSSMKPVFMQMWFLPGLARGISSQLDGVVVALLYIMVVLLKGEHPKFEVVLKGHVHLSAALECAGSIFSLLGCIGYLKFRTYVVDMALKLPEVRKDFQTGDLKLVSADVSWPVKGADWTPMNRTVNQVPVLHGINFAPNKGELVLVCGANASGKTALLMTCLGELHLSEGELTKPPGVIGLQTQEPQLLDGTIEENVFFNVASCDGDTELLLQSLHAVELLTDMCDPSSTMYVKKQHTRVGTGGQELSGGQRARTMLARACYQVLTGAQTVLLDDPVTQVDNDMLNRVWEATVVRLMHGSTRIVAINSQLLERLAPSADRLVVLKEGRVAFNGTIAEAREGISVINEALGGEYDLNQDKEAVELPSDEEYKKLSNMMVGALRTQAAQNEDVDAADGIAKLIRESDPFRELIQEDIQLDIPKDIIAAATASQKLGVRSTTDAARAVISLPQQDWQELRMLLQHLERQHRSTDKVKDPITVWKMFWDNIGNFAALPLVTALSFILSERTALFAHIMKKWEGDTEGMYTSYYTVMLLVISVGMVFMFIFQEYLGARMKTDTVIGSMIKMQKTLTSLGMQYFWWQPQAGMDDYVMCRSIELGRFIEVAAVPGAFFKSLASLVFAVSQAGLSATLPVLCQAPIQYKIAQLGHWNSQLDTARYRIIFLGFQFMGQVLDQNIHVRANKAEAEMERRQWRPLSTLQYHAYWQQQANFLKTFLEQLVFLIMTSWFLTVTQTKRNEGQDPTVLYALVLAVTSYADSFLAFCSMLAPLIATVKLYSAYCKFVETEFIEDPCAGRTPVSWPTSGQISFQDVTFRYRPYSAAVLDKVSFEVLPGEKLGIVGRPGSGKSTVAGILSRLSPLKDVAPFSGGRVLVDGVDIDSIGYEALRAHIAVVPQDCVLLQGSLKANVGEEFTDAEVAVTLERLGFDARRVMQKDTLPEILATDLASVGLSAGERQLVVAARALVRRPKVVVLDECTASLSREQADLLQQALYEHYKETTVLSIAHRLRFVLKFDRILVLAKGTVVAHATLSELMEDTEGYFAANLRHEVLDEDGSKLLE